MRSNNAASVFTASLVAAALGLLIAATSAQRKSCRCFA